MVLFTCIELILLYFQDLCVAYVASLHVFKSLYLPLIAFIPEMSPSVLHMLELLLAYFLVCDGEILIESLLF